MTQTRLERWVHKYWLLSHKWHHPKKWPPITYGELIDGLRVFGYLPYYKVVKLSGELLHKVIVDEQPSTACQEAEVVVLSKKD